MIPLVFGILVLIGGSTSSVVKYAVSQIPPIELVALRSVIALCVIAPFVARITRIKLEKSVINLVVVNILFTANWISFAVGLPKTSVTIAQLVYVPTSLIVALLSFFILKERFTKIQIIGLTITIAGAFMIVLGSIKRTTAIFGDPLSNLVIFFGVFCWALYLVLSKRISKFYSPLTIIFYNFLAAILISIILIPFTSAKIDLVNLPKSAYLSVLFIGVISSALYFYLNQWFVKHSTPFISSLQIYPITIIASIFGVIFYHEEITLNLVASAVLIMSGVFLATSYQYIKNYGKN